MKNSKIAQLAQKSSPKVAQHMFTQKVDLILKSTAKTIMSTFDACLCSLCTTKAMTTYRKIVSTHRSKVNFTAGYSTFFVHISVELLCNMSEVGTDMLQHMSFQAMYA
jgi:hypothetical protein